MSEPNEQTRTMTEIKGHAVRVPDVRVTITQADGAAVEAPLGLRPIVVGTSAECELALKDPGVSRRHCELSLTDRGIVLKDLRSKNGTFIGSVRIVEVILDADIEAKIGGARLIAHVVGSPSTIPFSQESHFGDAIGKSLVMRALFHELGQAAKSTAPVLLVGEPGTGKRSLAEAVHRASPRSQGPFFVFDPTKGTSDMTVSGGTMYIDGPEEMSRDTQRMLLALAPSSSSQSVGVRVIAGTHHDLRSRVAAGLFSAELYRWLASVEVRVPPLRERKGDIRHLVEHFLKTMAPPQGPLPPEKMELLEAHAWPGNVRELREMVEQLAACAYLGERALFALLGPEPGGAKLLQLLYQKELEKARDDVVERFEKSYLKAKLEEHEGNVPEVAKEIGVTREHVYRLIRKYRLPKTHR